MGGHRGYLLAVLLIILAFNNVDGLALGLVLQDIKVDLRLSDSQLGFLSGIAFALFYSVMGIPIARWADRGNRVTIISLCVAAWSVMVAMSGLATSFAQLLFIRMGVGVGESGCVPATHSLIADHFNRAERPRAAAIYLLGGCLSTVIGYFLAGWLNELFGWRATFMMLGLPGLALAALAVFSLRDPRFYHSTTVESIPTVEANASTQASVKEVCVTLFHNTTFRHILLCFSVMSFFGYGILQWQPAFFIRSYGLHTGELGAWFAAIYGVGGVLGTYAGGELASRLAANDEPLQLKGIAVAYGLFGVISASIYISPDRYAAFALMGLAAVGLAAASGPLFATIQSLVPERMRATAIAILYLFANLIGLGLGPLAAGALSDAFRPWVGEESLRYALLALCPGYSWGSWHLWRASHTVRRDLEAVLGAPTMIDTTI
jgi:MFS family permease